MNAPSKPSVGYAICSEARAGTTFLSRVARSTGVLGSPSEWFNNAQRNSGFRKDPRARLAEAVIHSCTQNGVYGLKVFSAHFDSLRGLGWAGELSNLHFVHLVRRDLLGQAISLARALQTGQYKKDEASAGEPQFDFRLISDCLARIAFAQARWECWFARNGIDPLRLIYEQVMADPQEAAEAIAEHMGLTEKPRVDLHEVTLRVQRDDISGEWRRRFQRESCDRSYLDGGLVFSCLRKGGAFARWFSVRVSAPRECFGR